MTLLTGKLTVKCPREDREVEVKRTCSECKSFKHISWRGLTPYIACGD